MRCQLHPEALSENEEAAHSPILWNRQAGFAARASLLGGR